MKNQNHGTFGAVAEDKVIIDSLLMRRKKKYQRENLRLIEKTLKKFAK
jgi:hypothetical protein